MTNEGKVVDATYNLGSFTLILKKFMRLNSTKGSLHHIFVCFGGGTSLQIMSNKLLV